MQTLEFTHVINFDIFLRGGVGLLLGKHNRGGAYRVCTHMLSSRHYMASRAFSAINLQAGCVYTL